MVSCCSTGGIFNTSTDECEPSFNYWAEINWNIVSTQSMVPTAKIGGTKLRDHTAAESTSSNAFGQTFSGRYKGTSAQAIQLCAHATDSDGGSKTVEGDNAGDESHATIKITRRYS